MPHYPSKASLHNGRKQKRSPMKQVETPLVRPALEADASAVAHIVNDAYAHYISHNGRTPDPMLDDHAAYIRQSWVSVLEVDGAARGVLTLIPEPGAHLLDNVAVAPAHHRKGYGRMLLNFAEREALARDYLGIRLYTQGIMVENIGIYSRRGYVETHRALEKGLDRVFMTKLLE